MNRGYIFYIKDIHDCICQIEKFTKGMAFSDFVKDDKTNSAVVRKLEIMGEATKNIPLEIKQKCPDLPWTDMAKMRDKIIHSYFVVDQEIVWKTIKEKLPEMMPKIKKMLTDLYSQ